MAVLIPPLHNFAVQRSRRSTLYLGDCGLFSHLDTTSSLTLACTFTELQYTPPKLIFQLMPTILVSQVPHIHESQDKEARVKPRDQDASLLHDNAFKACSSHGRPPSRSQAICLTSVSPKDTLVLLVRSVWGKTFLSSVGFAVHDFSSRRVYGVGTVNCRQ